MEVGELVGLLNALKNEDFLEVLNDCGNLIALLESEEYPRGLPDKSQEAKGFLRLRR